MEHSTPTSAASTAQTASVTSASAPTGAPSTVSSSLNAVGASAATDTSSRAIYRSPAEDRRAIWARKHEKARRYAHEHNKDEAWYKHKKHVLICSWAGRPIYTRYGDDTMLAAYMGVVSAIISNFQRGNDTLRSIIAGDYTFVFLMRGPIYLICISNTGESALQLTSQLSFLYDQIRSILTGGIIQILESTPQYDLRNLMGGAELLLNDMISDCNRSAYCLL